MQIDQLGKVKTASAHLLHVINDILDISKIEAERLQLEQRAQAAPLRVEKLAKDQLQMRPATPAITHYTSYSEPSASPAQRNTAGRAP